MLLLPVGVPEEEFSGGYGLWSPKLTTLTLAQLEKDSKFRFPFHNEK